MRSSRIYPGRPPRSFPQVAGGSLRVPAEQLAASDRPPLGCSVVRRRTARAMDGESRPPTSRYVNRLLSHGPIPTAPRRRSESCAAAGPRPTRAAGHYEWQSGLHPTGPTRGGGTDRQVKSLRQSADRRRTAGLRQRTTPLPSECGLRWRARFVAILVTQVVPFRPCHLGRAIWA